MKCVNNISGASSQVDLEREDPGLTKLEDASGSRMDVSAVASVAVRELVGIPSSIQVLVSKVGVRDK